MLLPLAKGCDVALDAVVYPWAHGIRGPTLTGRWQGRLVSPGGARAMIVLDLRRATYDNGVYTSRPDPEIEGTGRWCADQGRFTAYSLHGDYDSGVLSLMLAPDSGATGLIMTGAKGTWARDSLLLGISLERAGPQGYHYNSADPDMRAPVSVVFHRGIGGGDVACPGAP